MLSGSKEFSGFEIIKVGWGHSGKYLVHGAADGWVAPLEFGHAVHVDRDGLDEPIPDVHEEVNECYLWNRQARRV